MHELLEAARCLVLVGADARDTDLLFASAVASPAEIVTSHSYAPAALASAPAGRA